MISLGRRVICMTRGHDWFNSTSGMFRIQLCGRCKKVRWLV